MAGVASAGQDPALTLAVCTNRLSRHVEHVIANARTLSPADTTLCIVDSPPGETQEAVARLRSAGVQIHQNPQNLGLSASRNQALALAETRYLVFLDDDARINPALLSAIRASFARGAGVVGVRLRPPEELRLERWFMGRPQYHYLALHRPDRPASVWGACMGIDLELVRRQGLRFRQELGRRGRALQSGDDTTFFRELVRGGARSDVLETVSATHHIAKERIRMRYLMRRAVWQGRSEVRRRQPWSGLQKEFRRNLDGVGGHPRLIALGLLYTASVAAGIAWEGIHHRRLPEQ